MNNYLVTYQFDNGAYIRNCKAVVSANNKDEAFSKVNQQVEKHYDETCYDMKAEELGEVFCITEL